MIMMATASATQAGDAAASAAPTAARLTRRERYHSPATMSSAVRARLSQGQARRQEAAAEWAAFSVINSLPTLPTFRVRCAA